MRIFSLNKNRMMSVFILLLNLSGCGSEINSEEGAAALQSLILLPLNQEAVFSLPQSSVLLPSLDNSKKCSEPIRSEDKVLFHPQSRVLCQYELSTASQPIFTIVSTAEIEEVVLQPIGVATDISSSSTIDIDLSTSIQGGLPSGHTLSDVHVLGPGSATISSDTIVYEVETVGPVRLVYLLENDFDEGESLVGTVDITVSDNINQPPVADDFSIEMTSSSSEIIDVFLYVDHPQGRNLRLLDVKSFTLAVDIVSILSFSISLSDAPIGTHYVTYMVGDDNGGIAVALGTIEIVERQPFGVITWGASASGGNSLEVKDQIDSGVIEVSSNQRSFAALKLDGSVVTWGNANLGGDSSSVSEQLTSGVKKIYSSLTGFAALKEDGSVVSWGDYINLGDGVDSGVITITTTNDAFAALREDGSVEVWGRPEYGGNSSSVADQLASGVSAVYSNNGAFSALKHDGSVVVWGDSGYVGTPPLSIDIKSMTSSHGVFAAIKKDGSVVTWGNSSEGGNISGYNNVESIFATYRAFAALKKDGSVVTWGADDWGANSSAVADQLESGVVTIASSGAAFAALKQDGSVVTWGGSGSGGDNSSVADQLKSGVVSITGSGSAFAALKRDGSVVTWGGSGYGGDSSAVEDELSVGVKALYSTKTTRPLAYGTGSAFAALKGDGSVVTWGSQTGGGDSSAVAGDLQSGVNGIYATWYAFAAAKSNL